MGKSRVLTSLTFKNWRNLRDVKIEDLTPLTVFIGANSSGKTNILEGLRFLHDAVERDIDEALNSRGGESEIRSIDAETKSPIEIGFSFLPGTRDDELTYKLSLEYAKEGNRQIKEVLTDSNGVDRMTSTNGHVKVRDKKGTNVETIAQVGLAVSALGRTSTYPQILSTFQFMTQRWQLLEEGFRPALRIPKPLGGETYRQPFFEPFSIPAVIESMKDNYRQLYDEFQADLKRLLIHVDTLETETNDREIRAVLHEKYYPDRIAPTVSAGTARIVGMLVAYYTLDDKLEKAPGLVTIEEPDTAVHPLLLGNLVALLRSYTEQEHPRQFILTTHNPQMLNYFEPEEVRVVERDEETGETWVEKVPDYLRETWLDRHRLGDAWMSRIIGGIPE